MKNHTPAYTSDLDFVPARIHVKKMVWENDIPSTLEDYIYLRNSNPKKWAYQIQIERLLYLDEKVKELHENIDSYQYLLWLYYWWKSIRDRLTIRGIEEHLKKTFKISISHKAIERFFSGLELDLAPKTSITKEWREKIKGTKRDIRYRTEFALANA